MENEKKDNIISLIPHKHTMLTKLIACLLIFTFTVTNVGYSYETRQLRELRDAECEDTTAVRGKLRRILYETEKKRTESGQLGSAKVAFDIMNAFSDRPADEDMNLMVTFKCPFKFCPMCLAQDAIREAGPRDADKEMLYLMFDQLRGFKKAHIVGTGEPGAYGKDLPPEDEPIRDFEPSEDLLDILWYAAARIEEVRLVTNAYLVPEGIDEARRFFAQFPENMVWLVSADPDHEKRMQKRTRKSLVRIIETMERLEEEGLIRTAYNVRVLEHDRDEES